MNVDLREWLGEENMVPAQTGECREEVRGDTLISDHKL